MKWIGWLLVLGGLLGIALLALLARRPDVVSLARADSPTASEARPEPGLHSAVEEGRREALGSQEESPFGFTMPGGLVVCVIDDADGSPIEGALVSLTDTLELNATLKARSANLKGVRANIESPALRGLLRELAIQATSGGDGCASFDQCPERATIQARLGERWGVATMNGIPPDRRVTVRVTKDLAVRVRIVGPDGIPRWGVPVALREPLDTQASSTRVTESESPDGVATFEHYQRRLQQGSDWRFAFAFPVLGDPSVAAGPVDPGAHLPELVLPGSGKLRIHARDSQGRAPHGGDFSLHLQAFDDTSGGEEVWPGGPWSRLYLDEEGAAELPWVGLGLRFQARIVLDQATCGTASIQGPKVDGEWVEREVRIENRPCELFGRLVFRDGRPWASTSFTVGVHTLPRRMEGYSQHHLQTESDGRFRLPILRSPSLGRPASVVFAAIHPAVQASVFVERALEAAIPDGGLDLGEIVLDHGPLLVAGRVIDAGGGPIQRARFELSASADSIGAQAPTLLVAPSLGSRVDGSFALVARDESAPAPGTPLLLTTSCRGHVTDAKHPVRLGEAGVEIRLVLAGSLEGTLELAEGIAPGDLDLVLVSGANQKESLHPKSKTFRFDSLAAGVYSLQALTAATRWSSDRVPLVQVDGLQIVAGEACRDPRLQPLRIEDDRIAVSVRVLDRSRAPIREAWVVAWGAGSFKTPLTNEDGECVVRVRSLPVDAEIGAVGYCGQHLSIGAHELTVALERGNPVRFTANLPPSGSDPEYRLRIQLFEVDASGARGSLAIRLGPRSQDVLDGSAGSPPVLLGPGTYECQPMISVLRPGTSAGGPLELAECPRVTVLDVPGEQRFVIEIPQAALDAALVKYGSP